MLTQSNVMNLVKEYSVKYFKGLVNCPVNFYHRKSSVYGFMRSRKTTLLTPNPIYSLHFNTFAFTKINEKEMKQIILHEMTHAYLFVQKRPCGHTPLFKAMLMTILKQELNFIATRSVTFFNAISEKEVSPAELLPKMPVNSAPALVLVSVPSGAVKTLVGNHTQYRVISTGKVGTFVKECILYGKKHVSLKIEGMMFPFTTNIENVVPA